MSTPPHTLMGGLLKLNPSPEPLGGEINIFHSVCPPKNAQSKESAIKKVQVVKESVPPP